jgi:putative nucleotidyltransferase with HDIG domain
MAIEYTEIKIPVGALQLGMHVIRLDRPWVETDFLMQGFIIDEAKIIDALVSQCDYVYIERCSIPDIEYNKHSISGSLNKVKGLITDRSLTNEIISKCKQEMPIRPPQGKNKISYINKIPTETALPSAKNAYRSAKTTVKNIMDGIRIGRMLDMNQARETVDQVVERILQNQDALAWLTKIKNKDEYTAEHSLNVSILSATFARHLGHSEDDIKSIALSGLLHDVGKAKVPNEILNKEGRFTKEEADIMMSHAIHGRNLLMSMTNRDLSAIDVAHCHHERMDGKGYPRKLVASEIPYFAKVIAIADAYDAITSNRCYDKGKASMEALDIIYKCKGTQFDTELVLEFIKCIGVYPPGSIVELKTGEVGIVIDTSVENKLKPRILLLLGQDKKELPKKIVNLNLNIKNEQGNTLMIARELTNGSYGVWLEEYLKQGFTF